MQTRETLRAKAEISALASRLDASMSAGLLTVGAAASLDTRLGACLSFHAVFRGELESFSKKVSVLQQGQEGFSDELFSSMVAEVAQQFERIRANYSEHCQQEDKLVFPIVQARLAQFFDCPKEHEVEGCSVCSVDHEDQQSEFQAVGILIAQLQVATLNGPAGGKRRAEVSKDLASAAMKLKAKLLDNMQKEDTLLLPIILQALRPEEITQLIQETMAAKPSETVQMISAVMAQKKHNGA